MMKVSAQRVRVTRTMIDVKSSPDTVYSVQFSRVSKDYPIYDVADTLSR